MIIVIIKWDSHSQVLTDSGECQEILFFSIGNMCFHQQIRDITSCSLLDRKSLGSHSVLVPISSVYLNEDTVPGVCLPSVHRTCVWFTVIVVLGRRQRRNVLTVYVSHTDVSGIRNQVPLCISSLSHSGNNNYLLGLYIPFVCAIVSFAPLPQTSI